MKKSRYFTLKELCRSRTALRKGIDNFPSFEVVSHLEELVAKLLEPLREAWGSPIAVTSGYRSSSLNRAVGGVRDSPHMKGYAADLVPLEKDAEALSPSRWSSFLRVGFPSTRSFWKQGAKLPGCIFRSAPLPERREGNIKR